MKLALGRWTLVLVAVAVTAAVTPTATPPAPSSRPARQPREAAALWARMPLAFVENRGQWDTAARFVAHRGALTAAFDTDSVALYLDQEATPVRLVFEGASANTTVGGEEKHGTTYSYFMGSDPARWRSGVVAYDRVRYRGMYPGIDVVVRQEGGQLEYDLRLAPETDLEQVVIRAEGTTGLELASDGSLVVQTARGPLRHTPPRTWDVGPSGEVRPIASQFRLLDRQRFGFEARSRDPSLALVVDPGLDWATFLGGSGDETVAGLAMTSDGSGDVVLAGQTRSPDFPRTGGNLVPVGLTPYVARLNATGTALVYATFFGGSFNHSVRHVALDTSDRPVVVGDTNSEDFPTTPGAFDRTPGNGFSGDYDAYVIKFNSNGSGLVFGTYLAGPPGTGWEQAWRAGHDSSDSVIVSGFTTSPGFPTTAGAYNRVHSGNQDIFVARLDPTGSTLTYSTFLGGNGKDDVFDMLVDAGGFVTLTGQTSSTSFPTTPGALDATLGNTADGFVTRLKLDGAGPADLKYSTFLGGSDWREAGVALAADPADPELVTVAGWTRSGDFPTTPGALLSQFVPVNGSMAFVARFRFPAAGGGSLLWSTFYGAPGNQAANDVVVDSTGAAIIVGSTAASNPPTTERAYDRVPNQAVGYGTSDAFVGRISADGSQLLYSTLLGGLAGETAQHVVYAGGTSVVVAGLTSSPDFPVTVGAFDPVYAADGKPSGNATPGTLAHDAFVARLTLEAPAGGDTTPPAAPEPRSPPEGATYTANVLAVPFDWTDVADPSGIEAYHVQISPNPTFTDDVAAEAKGWFEAWLPASLVVKGFSISQTGPRYWRVQALDRAGNRGPWSAARSITVQSPLPPTSPPALLSPPNSGSFAPGNVTFAWSAVPTAKFYTLQVDDSSTFASPVLIYATGLAQTQYTASLTVQRSYWWRVLAYNDSYTPGPWSAVRSFDIAAGSPPAPAPPTPAPTPTPPGSSGTGVASITPAELGLAGGASGQLTVALSGPAPADGAVVSLAAVYPQRLSLPPSVTVPAGSTSATFTVTVQPSQVYGSVGVVAEYGGVAQASWVHTYADEPVLELKSFTTSASTVAGGGTVQGTVGFLPGWVAPVGGAVVALGSTDPSLASVPASVTIPQGASSASFTITTQPVAAPTTVTVLASRSMTAYVTLEVLPPGALASLSLNPTTVTSGQSSQGTVTLSSPAPAGGVVVALSSHDTVVARVPASVTVPAGATGATFTIATGPIPGNAGTWSQITASAGGLARTATLNVNPPPPGTVPPTATPSPTPTPGPPTATPTGPLPAPNPLSPANDARLSSGDPILFDWSNVAGAASYTIQIDDSALFSSPLIVDQTVTASQFTTSSLPTATMWWRARANDAAGNPGAWSAVRRFEVRS